MFCLDVIVWWWQDGCVVVVCGTSLLPMPNLGNHVPTSKHTPLQVNHETYSLTERMLTPNIAPEIVSRNKRSVYTAKRQFLDALPKRQSVRLTSRQKRSLIANIKEHKELIAKLGPSLKAEEHPRNLKKRLVPKNKVRFLTHSLLIIWFMAPL